MSTDAPRSGEFNREEPIPGYRTVKLLGRGGCGEVWQAIAPGGIGKAIKIVYGEADVDPANANEATSVDLERRALNRIKDARHPLLLSIERAEMICGNLVIVTELADCSLKQHFQALRRIDNVGLPQDELFKYIGDTADVLDFLYANYSLQHLDVKPENILLVSGRAKLGDFGLVKNLYERSVSSVEGMTPTYAAPELFDGRPTRHSDQYSLALVYMHMLTGELPFSSGSTAQIATQHLRGVPNLAALPRPQQKVIARALSKDPALRFETCTAMVDALKKAALEGDPMPLQSSAGCGATGTIAGFYSRAAVESSRLAPTLTNANSEPAAGETRIDPHARSLMNDAGAHKAQLVSPLILFGVGGAAVEGLARFADLLNERIGSTENWPPVEIVAMDSHTRSLSTRFHRKDLDRVRIVPISLKPVESLGGDAKQLLRWLDRRWFYNIPRDNTTGGYRPLGRLALAMNAKRVRDELSSVISSVVDGVTGQVEQGTGTVLRIAPRVLVIGSICGGTGSGAVLDLSYAIRSELTRRGLSDDHVHGLLLQSTPPNNADRDKARANAYSTLLELEHYSRPGSHYPGEPFLNAAPFHGNNATFSRTHLLHLGDSLGPDEWNLAMVTLAEFIYAVTCTAAGEIIDKPPRGTGQTEPGHNVPPQVHSHHVVSLGAGKPFHQFLESETEVNRRLWQPMQKASQPASRECIHETNSRFVEACRIESESGEMGKLSSLIAASFAEASTAFPSDTLDRYLIIPGKVESSQSFAKLQSKLEVKSIIAGHQCDITLWTSRSPTTLERVADEIIDGVEIYKELARRLHTRVDVKWGSFEQNEIPNFAPSFEPCPEIERTQRVPVRVS